MYAILFDSFVDNPDDTHECTVILGGIGPMALPVISGRIPLEASVFNTLGDALCFMPDAKKADLIVGLNTGNWRAVPVDLVMREEPDHYKVAFAQNSFLAQLPTKPATGETYRCEPKTSITEKPDA